MTNKSIILRTLINKATQRAVQNSRDWQKRDFRIASNLSSGISSARVAFLKIEDQLEPEENSISGDYCRSLLEKMLIALESVWQIYRSLPSGYGEWECSALGIIEDDIKKLIADNYLPTQEQLKQTKKELELIENDR